MEVAVVIPTKNEEKYLPPLLKSLKKQTYKDFEVFVADAGSKDRTKEIAKKYECIITKGGLPAFGRDIAAKAAIKKGAKILIFIDSDVILPEKNFLKKSIAELKKRKLDLASVKIAPFYGKNKRKDIRIVLFYSAYNIIMSLSQKGEKPFMQNYMISKSKVHKKIGGFGEIEFGEDSAYSKKAAQMGYKFRILKTPGRALISPRRFEEKGFWKLLFLYLYLNAKIIFGHEFSSKEKKVYFK